MKKLLSLPYKIVEYLNDSGAYDASEWFFCSDPKDSRVGSGGGSAWLLDQCYQKSGDESDFDTWLNKDKKVLVHAGGESRRLPSYATSGKIFTPVPVYRWAVGQKIGQDLLTLQLPLFERIFEKAPDSLNTMIVSGDVLVKIKDNIDTLPEADILCFGIWSDTIRASSHGVFLSNKNSSGVLDFMLQKPAGEDLVRLSESHYFLLDVGIWILNDKAVDLLRKRSRSQESGEYCFYDLYGDFGLSLGENPMKYDAEISKLTTKLVILDNAEFYHFGSNESLLSSVESIQNLIYDQRIIRQSSIKPPIYVQNSEIKIKIPAANNYIWVENSFVGSGWRFSQYNIITGVPENDWNIKFETDICLDIVPVDEGAFVARPYNYYDIFKGSIKDPETIFMGIPFYMWLGERSLSLTDLNCQMDVDIQNAPIFPLCRDIDDLEKVIKWMIESPSGSPAENSDMSGVESEGRSIWLSSERLSAHQLMDRVDLSALFRQRERFRNSSLLKMANNWQSSVFYQIDLEDAAGLFASNGLPLPDMLPKEVSASISMKDNMFRSRVLQLKGEEYGLYEKSAFADLRRGMTESFINAKVLPVSTAMDDQIVWARSPVRIDLAGGWTDTPPYCLSNGGSVVTIAIELNDQPPIQVFVKKSKEYKITLRSIDMGAEEVIDKYEDLDSLILGSPFSIPKTALKLCGFHPDYSSCTYSSLSKQLYEFGHGLDITLLCAIPAGTGLGTSSVLAATVIGAISDMCNLNWDRNEICIKTLVLEQILTTGGGWQDQFGAIIPGVKHLRTSSGFIQTPVINWLPETLFTNSLYQPCHLLYYTGIVRTAKTILEEIVKGMFLNDSERLEVLERIRECSFDMAYAIQKNNFDLFGKLVGRSWELNKRLDPGVTNSEIDELISKIEDYILGCKLAGAGGGGYLYIVAKDPVAAAKVQQIMMQNRLNDKSRFVEISLSDKGLQISRS